MRTSRLNLRHFALFALLIAMPAIAQSAEILTVSAPLIDVQMETNYILLLMAVIQAVIIITLGSVIKALGGAGSVLLNNFKGNRATGVALLLLTFLSSDALAATAYSGPEVSPTTIFWFLLVANGLLFVMMISQLVILKGMIGIMVPERAEVIVIPERSFAENLLKKLTRTVKVENEKEIELHHEYDGIKELDNALPPWWLWLFYGTIAWSVLYFVNVHVLDIWPQQIEEYDQEMAQAKADVEAYLAMNAAAVDEKTVTVLIDDAALANGRSIYTANCQACHGSGGEGTVGPNLTDDHWKNGGGIHNIFKTIKYGVPERGMIAWKAQLNPVEIQAVASYIVSLHGTNPPGAKAPEGEVWVEEVPGNAEGAEEPVKESKAVAGLQQK